MTETDEDKVRRYTECLQNGIDLKRALKRLYDLNVAPDVYKSANTYHYVKNYESSPELAKYAKRVRDKLFGNRKREHNSESTEFKKPKKEEDANLDADAFAQAMRSGNSSNAPQKVAVDYSKYKVTKVVKVEPKTEPQDSSPCSSSSLAQSSPPKKVQKEYVPTVPTVMRSLHQKREIPQSESLRADENMFKPRKDRLKVFAGRRKKIGEDVGTLQALCQDVLASNVHLIDHVGVVPYALIKPALVNATVDQLRHILDVNPLLVEEADELFFDMVRREFPKYAEREKDGWTWREMYDRLVEKKQKKDNAKLEYLTSRIGKAHTGNNQGRQTMVIDTVHTKIRSKSFFNSAKDAQIKMSVTPSAIQLSQARKNIKTEGKSQLRSITPRGGGVPTVSRSRSSNNNVPGMPVKKTAPLMAKCKKMLKR